MCAKIAAKKFFSWPRLWGILQLSYTNLIIYKSYAFAIILKGQKMIKRPGQEN